MYTNSELWKEVASINKYIFMKSIVINVDAKTGAIIVSFIWNYFFLFVKIEGNESLREEATSRFKKLISISSSVGLKALLHSICDQLPFLSLYML